MIGYSDCSSITECYNLGNITSDGDCTGGLIGAEKKLDHNVIYIMYSYNCGNITSSKSQVGGIVGTAFRSVFQNLYNSGNVTGINYIGGIIGYSPSDNGAVGEPRYCYNMGEIQGKSYVGGIVGAFADSWNPGSSLYSANIGLVHGTNSYVGGIVGDMGASQNMRSNYYEENTALYGVGGSTLTNGRDFQTAKTVKEDMPSVLSIINSEGEYFVEDTNNIYPILKWQIPAETVE